HFSIVPGEPAQIDVSADRTRFRADGQSQAQVTARIYDAEGNTVDDGTPVNWDLSGVGTLVSADEETSGGTATAIVQAGDLDDSITLTATAGDAQADLALTA